MNDIANLVSTVTELLLWPVLVGLALLSLSALLHIGGAAREAWDRAGGRSWLRAQGPGDALTEQLLTERELVAEHALARLQLGMRLGPVLGLMGTLIPLAPALRAMATGELDILASELQVAFGTTVIGLLVGACFHVVHSRRRRWYQRDLHEMQRSLEVAGT